MSPTNVPTPDEELHNRGWHPQPVDFSASDSPWHWDHAEELNLSSTVLAAAHQRRRQDGADSYFTLDVAGDESLFVWFGDTLLMLVPR